MTPAQQAAIERLRRVDKGESITVVYSEPDVKAAGMLYDADIGEGADVALMLDDEIERLRAANSRPITAIIDDNAALRAENERLKAECKSLDCSGADEIASHQETLLINAALRQQVAELRQVLKEIRPKVDKAAFLCRCPGCDASIAARQMIDAALKEPSNA